MTGCVAIVLVNYNGWGHTLRCLESLDRLTYDARRIVVVDSASTDDSAEQISARRPDVSLVSLPVNRGFGAGCNAGVRHGLRWEPDAFWLLNNDTIVEPDTLRHLVAELDADPRAGVVGGVVKEAARPSRTEVVGGGYVDHWRGLPRAWVAPRGRPDWITGACMLVRRTVFDDIGGFDEDYFLYSEDVDLCLRAAMHGWRMAVVERAVVYHRRGVATGARTGALPIGTDRARVRSAGLLIATHGDARVLAAVPIRMASLVARCLLRRQLGRLHLLLRDFLSGVRLGWAKRRRLRAVAPSS